MPVCQLQWMANFGVGVDELDADHREMYDLMIEISRSSLSGNRAAISQQMAAFIELAGAPLDLEEVPARLADWFCRQAIGHDAKIRAHFHRAATPRTFRGSPSRPSELSAGPGVFTAAIKYPGQRG